MKPQLIILLIVLFVISPFGPEIGHAQTSTNMDDPNNPDLYWGVQDEGLDPALNQNVTSNSGSSDPGTALQNINDLDAELGNLTDAFGYKDASGQYVTGSLGRLKLKPSDKQRLIKIANGSLTDKEKQQIQYDQRLMDLLVTLVTPKEQGGGGLTYLRVGDLLRYRNDPRSTETESTDNISQHQYGKAADVIEINTTRCTKKSFFSSKKLEPFPVKVAWQGGAPNNPNMSVLGAFDAIARANAFRDILGALPGDSYNGSIHGLDDLLQQMQRRVLAKEAGLNPGDLDYVSHNDTLETIGQTAVDKSLGFPPSALTGDSEDDLIRSIPRSFIEKELLVPPTSLKGDDWNQSLERLGRFIVAYQVGVDPNEILNGHVDAVIKSPYYSQYSALEEAYRLPPGSLAGLKQNKPEAFRQVGAELIADRLQYNPEERDALINQAQNNSVKQLSLARYGDMANLPGSALVIMAPVDSSSKAKGETYLGNAILKSPSSVTTAELPDEVRSVITGNASVFNSLQNREAIARFLIKSSPDKLRSMYHQIGANYIENSFDLPTNSLVDALKKNNDPSLLQFLAVLGDKANKNDVPNPNDTALNRGKAYFESHVRSAVSDVYHVASTGPTALSSEDVYSLLLGKTNDAATRAGAAWVEEDLGLVPDSFSSFFAPGSAEDRLVSAGLQTVGGEMFDAFNVDPKNMNTGTDFKVAIGQAKIETALGLKPGSWRDNLANVKAANAGRFDIIFTDPTEVDTILGLASGTSKQFLDATTQPKDMAITVGSQNLDQLKSEDLQNKFGWDSNYRVDGEKLLRTINSGDGTTKDVKSGNSVTMKSVLAQIGGYNSDFAFGYDPGTMATWLNAPKDGNQNRIFAEQGAKLYSDRLGIDSKVRDALYQSYATGKEDAKRKVTDELKNKLELTNDPAVREQILQAAKEQARQQVDELQASLSNTPAKNESQRAAIAAAQEALRKANDKLSQKTDTDPGITRTRDANTVRNPQTKVSLNDLLNSAKQDIATAKAAIDNTNPNTTDTPLLTATQTKLGELSGQMSGEIAKWEARNKLPNVAFTIPTEDLNSFVNGNMKLANAVIVAAQQAKQNVAEIQDAYQLFRLIVAGWSSNKDYEHSLATDITNRYAAVLQDYVAAQAVKAVDSAETYVDQQFSQLTKGAMNPDGTYNPNATPYDTSTIEKIRNGYFSNKEAHNNFYYAVMDTEIKKNDPTIPANFSKTMLEGSNKDRSLMIYTYLGKNLSSSLISSLPADIRPIATQYLQLYDPKSGKIRNPEFDPNKEITDANRTTLNKDAVFDDWANKIITVSLRRQDSTLPNDIGNTIRNGTDYERTQLALQYLQKKSGEGIISTLPSALQPLGLTYLQNYDQTTGKINNPKFDPKLPESDKNQRYIPSNAVLDDWAKNTFSTYIQKLDPNLPANAGSVIMSGNDLDRRKLAFSYISTKINDTIISSLPKDLQSLASSYMQNFDVKTGKILGSNDIFIDWSANIVSNFIGNIIPPSVMKLAVQYINGELDPTVIGIKLGEQLADKIDSFIALGKEKLVEWVGKAIGLPVGVMKTYYDKYKQVQQVYSAFKGGKVDATAVVLAVDQLFLNGTISKLTNKLDSALGLPAGSSLLLIQFAVTGNPIYVIQFAFNLFFASTVVCPNLQQEAQKNVEGLISSILDIGRNHRELVPSQIITFNQSYITNLADKIRLNYLQCLEDTKARCGVFARPEYSRQVHIGF